MPAMQSRHLEFTYIACGPFSQKKKKNTKIFKKKRLKVYFSKRFAQILFLA